MSDLTWRDEHDDGHGLADRLDDMVDRLAKRGLYSEATLAYQAALALRELQEQAGKEVAA